MTLVITFLFMHFFPTFQKKKTSKVIIAGILEIMIMKSLPIMLSRPLIPFSSIAIVLLWQTIIKF